MTKFRVGLEPAEYLREVDDKLLRYVREVRDAPEVAIDTETTGLLTWREVPLFFSLAWQAPEGVVRRVCLPIRLISVFEESFRDPEKKWILANAKFDMHMLANIGVRVAGPWYDVQVMHALLYEDEKHGLKAMHQAIFGWSWPDFGKTFGIKKGKNAPATGTVLLEMERTRPQVLAEYAANDAYGTLMLYYWLKDMLQKQPTWSAYPETYDTLWDIYYKTELPYTKVLWKCERRGMLLDLDYLDNCRGPIEDQIEELEREIVTLRGKMFNVDSTAELRTWFYNELHIKPLDWSKGGKNGKRVPKVDKEFYEHYAYYPAVKLVKEYNGLRKFLSTFVLPMWGIVDPESRIHTTLRQARASCMPAGELVLTARGYLPVEEVRVGDTVLSHTGVPRQVTETSRHVPQPIYRVTLSNGLSLRTTGNHEYFTGDSWVRADNLAPGGTVAVHADQEVWKDIPGWLPYQVSSWGRVRHHRTKHVLRLSPKGKWGHLKVCISRNGAQKRGPDRKDFTVQRLVLLAFRGDSSLEARHLNGIAWDNTLGNLEYGTPKQNRADALVHGSMSRRRVGRTKLTEKEVQDIRNAVICPQEGSPNSKLSYALAEEMRRKKKEEGKTCTALAREYGIGVSSASSILLGQTWTKPTVEGTTVEALAKLYGVSRDHVTSIRRGSRWRSEDYITGKRVSFYTATVVQVVVEAVEETFGLTVEVDHSHVTGGIVTHNTGRLSCVAAWTPVVTPSGPQPIAQLRVGDYVYTHRHRWRRVLATIRKGVDMMYDVRLSTGEVLTCTAKHRLLTSSGRWLPVGELVQVREERCVDQPGTHHADEKQQYPLLVGKGLDVCRIEEIVPRGCCEVYDITVEEDESYEACGVFSHNSSDPNCQNVPNPDKDKHKVRKAFIAPPGKSLLVHDYDQLEMRLVAVGAQAWPMVQMFIDKKDIHIGNAVSVLNKLWQRKYGVTLTYDLIKEAKHQQERLKKKQISPEEFTDTFAKCCLARGAVKAVGYGLNYGIGDDKLAGQIGCLPSEAYETRMEYFHEYPGIKMFFDLSVQIARHTGYAFTYLGRRRFLGQIHSRWQRDRAAAERRAGNMAIQGCLPASTRVLTTKGYLPIGDIPATGEVWTGHAFKPYKKLYRGAWELAELLLSNGQILSCDTRHKVLVATEQDYVFKSYEELEEGDRICLSVAQPVHFGRALPRGDAYWMGFALGNGCTAQGTAHHNALTITAGDRVGCYTKEGMTAAFSAYVQRLGISPQKPRRSPTKISVTVESAAFKDRWLRLGYCWGETAHTKRVPAAIWTASLSARKAFLRGMLDADGAVLHDTPNIHLCQRELLADLQMLFRTVGVDAVLRGPYVDGTAVSWRLDMSPGQLHAVFRLGTPRMPEITRMPVPAGVLRASEQSLRALQLSSKSQQAIRNRVLRGGPANTYTLLHLYDVAKRAPPQVYATRTLVRKVAIGREESTYTLSVDDPGHRFDSEGVISKNTAAEVVKLAMLHCDEDPRLKELGAEMTMQVHDELLHEIPTDAAEEGDKRVREIMEHPFERDIGVPLTVGGGAAGNWYEAK